MSVFGDKQSLLWSSNFIINSRVYVRAIEVPIRPSASTSLSSFTFCG